MELEIRKGISEKPTYICINSVMDVLRQVLTEGKEVRIGSFGRFTVVTVLSGG